MTSKKLQFPRIEPPCTDPGEKFENVTMLLFRPFGDEEAPPEIRLIDAKTRRQMTEAEYFRMLRSLYNQRNPHAAVGVEGFDILDDEQPAPDASGEEF